MVAPAELMPVQPQHRFDEARLAAYLQANLADFRPPLTVNQFKGSQAAPTFLLHSPGQNHVLRKRQVAKKGSTLAESVERDFALISKLHAAGLPMGMPRLVCLDDSVIGTPFYLLDYIAGRHFRDPNLPGMDAKQRQAIYLAMAQAMAQVHGLDPHSLGLPTNGDGSAYLARQVAALVQQYNANRTEEIGAMARLLDWLPANVPQDGMTSLMHGNFRLDNLVFHPSESHVVAMLDWDVASIGHPLADLAINCMPYRVTIPGMGSLQGVDYIDSGIPGEHDYVAAYCAARGIEGIAHWNFFLAFALFRVAVMAQGIHKRGLERGPATPTIKAYAAVVRSVANQAWNLVDGGDD
ncbi:phosphotransferase [Ferrovibrio sp.]|uniref:phosphotransferase n=1 Tax=Ferrovibrio sp. TaxID=1917215 RepID=UPI001B567DE0|nr:phosphotransferase [Ferrovibrio sp.]MBP7065065.1 phosphotransferase [Ferrovibrio sp.]